MNRRKFLLWTGIGAGGIIIPTSLYFLSPETKEYAIAFIKKELSFLKLEKGSVEKYMTDYFQQTRNDLLLRLKWKTMYYLNTDSSQSNVLFELVKYYLLSTDFFINKIDETLTVRYLGLYSPYTSPFPNPFSFILYPPETIKDL